MIEKCLVWSELTLITCVYIATMPLVNILQTFRFVLFLYTKPLCFLHQVYVIDLPSIVQVSLKKSMNTTSLYTYFIVAYFKVGN